MAKAKHTIRIISGTHRSRRVPVLAISGLRPTGDRLREVLFNWLQLDIAGKNILDLCAGSGALGFEAASRGAKQVTMVELNPQAAKQLLQVTSDFNFNNIQIINQRAQSYLSNTVRKFDVVFLDPPFSSDLLHELTELVVPLIVAGGFLYRESSSEQELINLPANWNLYRQKTASQVKIELWQRMTQIAGEQYAKKIINRSLSRDF
ncbi:16S rRNA (guanine(966)-N(2))-methyltransferase [hydrothermal vent metagenome]|uniref:16S rRNA (Guanine(966)-N(2))-methyltransferase n=1 Tax=hydrothermal vent metagenome TaxID=652676 RepID=A0A3B0V3Q6_9ZZZZ